MSASGRHLLLGPVRLFGARIPEPTPFERQGTAESGPRIPRYDAYTLAARYARSVCKIL
jgi:hypothetical protein